MWNNIRPGTRARTKIVATVGPASWQEEKLADLAMAGVDVFRLNMAHGDMSRHEHTVQSIRRVSAQLHRPLAILADLGGPKIRLGQLFGDPVECREGAHFTLIRGETATKWTELSSSYPQLIDEVSMDDRVLLADGTVAMRVVEKQKDFIVLRVEQPGMILSRQGINLPGAKLSVQTPTEEDIEHATWAAKQGVDFIGLSFVRTPDEIHRLRLILQEHGSHAHIIAKIEKPEALQNLDAIVSAADGAMVARGDLGVEIDVADIAVVQKWIISTCAEQGKPVIVATQMLESMRSGRHPTRAEATDVANAILDGADACMLSAETAIGDHPKEVVKMMNRIALSTERLLASSTPVRQEPFDDKTKSPITRALVFASAEIARLIGAKLVVVASRTGTTAIVKAKQRDFIPAVGISSSAETLRQMCLLWGITPLMDAPLDDFGKLTDFVCSWGKVEGRLAKDDRIVFVAGTGTVEMHHDQLIVHTVD